MITTRRALEVILSRIPMPNYLSSALFMHLATAIQKEKHEQIPQDEIDKDRVVAAIGAAADHLTGIAGLPAAALITRAQASRQILAGIIDDLRSDDPS